MQPVFYDQKAVLDIQTLINFIFIDWFNFFEIFYSESLLWSEELWYARKSIYEKWREIFDSLTPVNSSLR